MFKQWCLLFLISLCSACGSTTASNTTTATDIEMNPWLDKPAHMQVNAIKSGDVSSQSLVKAYLNRIQLLDKQVNSVLALNPRAIEEAVAIDKRIASGDDVGPLAGIPILLKDNIESSELPTTAGSMALLNNFTQRDAPIVAKLKQAGAIILGKTNLSEWANFRSESSISGWSAVGGLTRNPHILSRSACGSSSGSGAAMALRLASLAVGTETNGSIICPASMNGVVGFKPTVGLLSRTHIVPISFSQDTAGPMTTNVQDAWLMTSLMAGHDGLDLVTQEADSYIPILPRQGMAEKDLKGVRIGVVRYRQGDNPQVISKYNQALKQLSELGATLVDIREFEQPERFWSDSYSVLLSEFHTSINHYLSTTPASLPVNDLASLIAFNSNNPREMALFNQDIFQKSLLAEPIESESYLTARQLVQSAAGIEGIDKLMAQRNVDILVAPSNSPAFLIDGVYGDHSPVGFIGIGYLAAVAGYPHLTLPIGAIKNLPVGLSFIGGKWQDEDVLRIGQIFEAKHEFTIRPNLLPTAFDASELKAVLQGIQ